MYSTTETIKKTYILERLHQVLVRDVQDTGREHSALVIHLLHYQAIGEGRDVQHVEECGLAGTHLVSFLHQLHIILYRKNATVNDT